MATSSPTKNLQGRFVLIYFGYMGCPDVCPTTMSTIADVMEQLGDKAEGVVPCSSPSTPSVDTAKELREYIHFLDKRIIGLRGPKAYTDHMVKVFNARYEIHTPDPETPGSVCRRSHRLGGVCRPRRGVDPAVPAWHGRRGHHPRHSRYHGHGTVELRVSGV